MRRRRIHPAYAWSWCQFQQFRADTSAVIPPSLWERVSPWIVPSCAGVLVAMVVWVAIVGYRP